MKQLQKNDWMFIDLNQFYFFVNIAWEFFFYIYLYSKLNRKQIVGYGIVFVHLR